MRTYSYKTQICAVIGNPIAHSLSPAIHNAAFEFLDLDFIYLACPVQNVKDALAGMRAIENFRGLSVTIPHKTEVMKYVDDIAAVDRNIGSINTVIHEQDKLIGLGTDGSGALKALAESGVEKTTLRELSILDVNDALLQGLTTDLTTGTDAVIKSGSLTEDTVAAAMAIADIIIHCTPVGMHPNVDASLIAPQSFRPEQVVFDIVYNPLETKLLADAKSLGLKIIPGVEMFINQAVLQFEQFTGVDAPVDVMRRVVMEHLAA